MGTVSFSALVAWGGFVLVFLPLLPGEGLVGALAFLPLLVAGKGGS